MPEDWKLHRDKAPWGHDRLPTVWEATRGRPGIAFASLLFSLAFSAFLYLVVNDSGPRAERYAPLVFLLTPLEWWLSMFGQIRGWFGSPEFGGD